MKQSSTRLYKLHTGTLLCLLFAVTGVTAVCVHPFLSPLSCLMGALSLLCYGMEAELRALLRFTAPVSLLLILFNFVLNHNGATVLFYLGDFPILLESCLYAILSALSFSAIVFWFSFFCTYLDADRIFLWCAGFSKNFAILFSLSMSFVPQILKKYAQIEAQAKETENEKTKLLNLSLRLSTLLSWVLEDSFETAVSMKARGATLPIQRRKKITAHRWQDVFFMLFSFCMMLLPWLFPRLRTSVYPAFSWAAYWDKQQLVLYSCIAFLLCIPVILKIWEEVQWKFTQRNM